MTGLTTLACQIDVSVITTAAERDRHLDRVTTKIRAQLRQRHHDLIESVRTKYPLLEDRVGKYSAFAPLRVSPWDEAAGVHASPGDSQRRHPTG